MWGLPSGFAGIYVGSLFYSGVAGTAQGFQEMYRVFPEPFGVFTEKGLNDCAAHGHYFFTFLAVAIKEGQENFWAVLKVQADILAFFLDFAVGFDTWKHTSGDVKD